LIIKDSIFIIKLLLKAIEIIRMRIVKQLIWLTIFFLTTGCVPFDKIYNHELNSGYFKFKTPDANPESVFLCLTDNSIGVYPVTNRGKFLLPDTTKFRGIKISSISPGSFLYNSTFIKTSVDVDLSTVILKFRPAMADVQPQLSTNVNGIFYAGFRKDYFKIKSSSSELDKLTAFVRHTGFDFGLFAGIGITPVNPTVTMNRTIQEYDGIVFQKGFSVFATYENMSVGLAVGFDNLIGHDKNIWIYNQKPWIGLVFGIANF